MARPDWAEEFAALDRPEVLDALVRVLGESDFLWEDYLHAQPENLLPMICDPAEWRRRRTPAELAADRDAALATAPTWTGRPGRSGGSATASSSAPVSARSSASAAGRRGSRPSCPTSPRSCSGRRPGRARGARPGPPPDAPTAAPCPRRSWPWASAAAGSWGSASDLELMLVYDDRDRAIAGPRRGRSSTATSRPCSRCSPARGGARSTSTSGSGPTGGPVRRPRRSSAFVDYYRAGGPAWGYERQALIKLRVVAGDPRLGREVEALRDRFVYGPEPFDLDGCRRLRRLQVEQLVQPGTINAKYSPGALVDVEYFVQALQIAHGGARAVACGRPTPSGRSTALEAVRPAGRRTASDGSAASYRFFRMLIDALRVVHGHAQDLTVPPAGSDEFVAARPPDAPGRPRRSSGPSWTGPCAGSPRSGPTAGRLLGGAG